MDRLIFPPVDCGTIGRSYTGGIGTSIIEATIAAGKKRILKIPVSDRSGILSLKDIAESTALRGTQKPQFMALYS